MLQLVFRLISYKILGKTISEALLSSLRVKLNEAETLVCRRVWYGGMMMIMGNFFNLMLSRNLIEFGVRGDALVRGIEYVLSINVVENVPAFYECLKVIILSNISIISIFLQISSLKFETRIYIFSLQSTGFYINLYVHLQTVSEFI